MSYSALGFIGLPATAACLWLQFHTRMSRPEEAVAHLESPLKKKKRSKSLSSSLNDKLSSLVLWAQSQNSLPIAQTSAIRLI